MPQKQEGPAPFPPDLSLDKPLPDNLEAERLVLASVFLDKESLSVVMDSVAEEDFCLNKHRIIFQRICSLFKLGIAVDRITLVESLIANGQLESVDGMFYIASLDNGMPRVSNLLDYVKILKDKSKLRALIALGQSVINAGMEPSANPAQMVQDLDRQIYKTFAIATKSKLEKLAAYIDRTPVSTLTNTKGFDDLGVYTGYRELDRITDGLHDAEIMVIGASTSVGKSSAAIQIAASNAVKGIPVSLYTLEMPKKAVYDRLIAMYARVPVIRLISNALSKEERGRVMDANSFIYELPIYIDDNPRLKPSALMMSNKRAKEYFGVKMGIVDYIQKMHADYARNTQMLERLTEVCDSMVDVAKETTPMVVLSQLSREHSKNKEKPSTDDLKGGAVVGEMAQVIILLHRPEMDRGKSGDQSLRGKAEFIVAKNRNSRIKNIPMRYVGWRMSFEDLEEEPKEQEEMEF